MIETQFEKLTLFEKLKLISNPQLCTKIEFRRELVVKDNKGTALEFKYILYRINNFLVEAKFIEHAASHNPIDVYSVDKELVRLKYNSYWKNIQNKYTNRKSYEIWVNNNIVVIKIKRKAYVTSEIVEEMLQDRKLYQQGMYMSTILDVRDAKNIDKKAIKTLTEEKYFEFVIGIVIITKSYFQKLLLDTYKKMLQAKNYHPPTYMCYNMYDALNWVKQFDKQPDVVEEKDIEKVKVSLEEGIITVKYLEKYITQEVVDISVQKRLQMSNGKANPVLIDLSDVKGATPDAINKCKDPGYFQLINAVAFLIKTSYTELIFNVEKNYDKYSMPYKVLRTKKNAIKFLENYV